MNILKKWLTLILATFLFVSNISTKALANVSNQNRNFEISKGMNENQVVITENGKSFILESFSKSGYKYINLYDDSNNLISSDVIKFSDFKENQDSNHSEQLLNNTAYRSNGNGTKENPYKFCTPGKVTYKTSKLSYSQILGMAGATISAVNITKAIMSLTGIAAASFHSTAGKTLIVELVSVLGSNNSNIWLSKHGVKLKFRSNCTLQNYVDGAWGDNEWFYGESESIVGHSRY